MEQTAIQNAVEWWLKTGLLHGLGLVTVACIMLLFLWVLAFGAKEIIGILRHVRHSIPRVVQAHMGFVESTKETNARVADAVQTLTDTHTTSGSNHTKTHRTMAKSLIAAKEMAKRAGMEHIVVLIEDAEEELER